MPIVDPGTILAAACCGALIGYALHGLVRHFQQPTRRR